MTDVLRQIRHGLIVSCQAACGSPLHGPLFMAAMAESAERGGAGGIRADGEADIRAIKARVRLPMIGILKRRDLGPDVWITPDLRSALAVVRAGAEIIAMDGTRRPRPDGTTFAMIVRELKREVSALVMADVSTLEEGLAAADAGADLVATTLSGYTPYSPSQRSPDLDLVEALSGRLSIPVIAEGRYSTPEDARRAIERGAHAVVVGQAITNPMTTTRRFVAELAERHVP